MQTPEYCRREAYALFAEQIPVVETTAGLLNAAVAISQHALRGIDPRAVESRLSELAERVRVRVRGPQIQAKLAHLHQVLFEEEDFRGNADDYYNTANSYLPAVLATRRGIPITLSLIYKVTAEKIGLEVEGVNAPGHFLVRIKDGSASMIVDPFFFGSLLRDEEAFDRIEQVTGRAVPRSAQYLAAATHSQWLSRILVNLQHIYANQDRHRDLAAMTELQSLLDYSLY